MVSWPDGSIDFFDIVTGVFQGDIFAPNILINWLVYILRTSIDLIKENTFTVKKTPTRRYRTEIMTSADYTDDLELLTNTPA